MSVGVDAGLVFGLDCAAYVSDDLVKLFKISKYSLPLFILSHRLILLLNKPQIMHPLLNLTSQHLILLNPNIRHRPKKLLHHQILQMKILHNHNRNFLTELSLKPP